MFLLYRLMRKAFFDWVGILIPDAIASAKIYSVLLYTLI